MLERIIKILEFYIMSGISENELYLGLFLKMIISLTKALIFVFDIIILVLLVFNLNPTSKI